MQNITKIDWRTKKISDQDLSIKLFNCLSDLYKFIHSNNNRLAFANLKKTKIDNTGISVKVLSKYKWIKPQYHIEEIIHKFETDRFDINIDKSPFSVLSLKTNDYQSEGWYDDYTITSTIRMTLNVSLFTINKNVDKYINTCLSFIKKIPKKSRNKLVKMIYLSIFLIIDSLVWIVLYIFSKEYLVPYIVKPFLISVLSLSPTPGMGPILNYIKDTEGEIRKAYRDNGDVPEVNPSYKLLSIIVSGILNLVIVIIFLKYGKINKQINWLNNISNQRT